jgi:hypothetical protein
MNVRTGYRGISAEVERPIEARLDRVWIGYFPRAGRLQLAYYYRHNGQERRRPSITLNLTNLRKHPEVRALICEALDCNKR